MGSSCWAFPRGGLEYIVNGSLRLMVFPTFTGVLTCIYLQLADNSNQHLRNKAFDALDQSICAVLGSDQFQENAAFRLHVESCDVRIVYSPA